MRKSQILVISVFILSLCASAAFAAEVPSTSSIAATVNINTADVTQLCYLPKVGEKAAQRVVDFRTAHGPFHKTTDLMQVKGFGEKRFESLNNYLSVSGPTTLAAKIKKTRTSRGHKSSGRTSKASHKAAASR